MRATDICGQTVGQYWYFVAPAILKGTRMCVKQLITLHGVQCAEWKYNCCGTSRTSLPFILNTGIPEADDTTGGKTIV